MKHMFVPQLQGVLRIWQTLINCPLPNTI